MAYPPSFDRFREVWDCDAEYCQDGNHRPDIVTLFAKEMRSGRTVRMTRRELLATTSLPFGTEPDTLTSAYAATAELNCFAALKVAPPANVICSFAEVIATINGRDVMGLGGRRPNLLEACNLYGVPHMTAARKKAMRNLILEKGPDRLTGDEMSRIEDYNREDVEAEAALIEKIAPNIDIQHAVVRGRYLKAVSAMEHVGAPLDADYLLGEVAPQWQAVRLHFIRRLDRLGLYDVDGRFSEERLSDLDRRYGWDWPRTANGRLETGRGAFARAADRLGEPRDPPGPLRQFQRLHDLVAELRLNKLAETVGDDGAAGVSTMPFWTTTGRNQPQGRDRAPFILSLPEWAHGFIKPPEGYGIAELDFVAQEVGYGAGASGDGAMIADYLSGDPHIGFAIRFGLAPAGATKATHKALRDMVKPVVLGIPYNMTKWGVARKTRLPILRAAEILAGHRQAYPTYYRWRKNVVGQAAVDGLIESPRLCWPMAVTPETTLNALYNFKHQSGGADMLRIAAIAAHEAGILVIAMVHDAFWIMAPVAELDDAVTMMKRIMTRAGEEVAGIPIGVEESARVLWPDSLGDVRERARRSDDSPSLWRQVQELVRGGLSRAA